MRKYSFKAIKRGFLATALSAIFTLAFVAYASAMTPTLTLNSNNNGYGYGTVQVTVYGDANAPVILDYYSGGQLLGAGVIGYTNYSGSFSGQLSTSNYTIPNGAQTIVMVNGQQSNTISWMGTSSYNNNGGTTNGTLSLSQSSVTLSLGQSQTVSLNNGSSYNYNYNNYNSASQYYISNSNTNNIVTASISGNSISLYGQSIGSTTLNICPNNSISGLSNYYNSNGGCATLYVTVSGNNNNYYYPQQQTPYYQPVNNNYYGYNNTPLSVSNSNVQVTVGNVGTVVINSDNNSNSYYNNSGTYYISNNNNGIANATISGNTLSIYGTAAGSTTVTVCQSGTNQCTSVNVTVTSPSYFNYTNGQYTSSQNGHWYYSNQNRCWQHR